MYTKMQLAVGFYTVFREISKHEQNEQSCKASYKNLATNDAT